MKVIGVDGCRGGWVAMVWDIERGEIVPEIHLTLADLIAAHEKAGAIAIDIPIGLNDTGTRRCDLEARRLLRPTRASSVFPPPPSDILHAATHAEAVVLSRNLIGKGVPIQAFAIFGKMQEANDLVTPEMQDRVVEMHPEVSFCMLAGYPMIHRKAGQTGYEERRALLEAATGISLPDRKTAFTWARPAKPDDLLDAAVAAWTARRVADGTAGRLPVDPEYAPSGHRMEMVY